LQGTLRERRAEMDPKSKADFESKAISEYQSGHTIQEIASRTGVPYSSIRQILIRNEVTRRPAGRAPMLLLSPEKRKDAVERYSLGASIAKLALEHGVSYSYMRQTLIAEEIELRPGAGALLKGDRNKEVIDLYSSSNKSFSAIGRHFGISRQRVCHVITANEVARRPSKADPRKDKLTQESMVRMRSQYHQGKSTREIAQEFQVHTSTIMRLLRAEIQNLRTEKERRAQRCIELYKQELSLKEVAAIVGISWTGVKWHVRRAGVLRTISQGVRLRRARRRCQY
jgi:transposase/DNA-binding CsgD family transcriptional regulator